jgi:hypothetical protein
MATKPSPSDLTEMQEKTSAWIFDQALNYNRKYKSADDIISDDKFKNEIIGTSKKPGIYPFVDSTWINSYYKQQKKFLDEFSDAKFKEFSVKGGFMDFVSKLVTQKFEISKKDAWDPADVWCVQNEAQVIKMVKDAIKDSNDVEKLNTILRTLFKERKVVGISLKLVDTRVKIARYQEVNVKKGVLFASGRHPSFIISEIRCDLKMRPDGLFKANDTRIYFTVNYTKETIPYEFTMRTTGRTYKPGNLQYSFSETGAAAQIGKAPVELVEKAAKKYKIDLNNKWQNYPSSILQFNSEKKKYKDMFEKIKTKVNTNGASTSKEFIDSISKMFLDKDNYGTANSKLMQIEILYQLISLPKAKFEGFITDLFFLAEKRGDGFGPFGKLY